MSNIVTEPGTEKPHLQEIALAEGSTSRSLEPEREMRQELFLNNLEMLEADNEEPKLKTGSLKRFFRKNPKKASESSVADMRTEEQNPTDGDEMNGEAGSSSEANEESFKRFKYLLGGKYRYSNSKDMESKTDLSDTASKVTLKSSLSSYWNSVFKKKKSKSAHEVGRREPMEITPANNFSESALQSPQRGNALAEDIHALKISEDPNGN